MKFAPLIIAVIALVIPVSGFTAERERWNSYARNVTITRDDWGIAHVKGRTDADAVFGMIYAQAEDDLNRIETNYLTSLGRLAEAEGEKAIWQDLRMKLFIDPAILKKEYAASPDWLKRLMTAWADGLNFYLAKHPQVKPRVITHFEPWMALSFTEGSIGGDIETISLDGLRKMYTEELPAPVASLDIQEPEPSGSNGFAIAPKNTKNGHALFLINPHTSFFFRSVQQVTSGEGLNVYGASTWGQFFVYQGFNQYCGWMHTSSAVDAIDEFRETIVRRGNRFYYRFGKEERLVSHRVIDIPYRLPDGTMGVRSIDTFATHHGPVVRKDAEGNWITVSLMNTPIKALMQSFGRTKARNIREFQKVMQLQANSSNNTIYADRDGNIAYFHANYVPVRDARFDWTKPVDGSDPATEYRGLLSFKDAPNLINPSTGWVYNSNNWPWSAAGRASLKRADYPRWVDNGVETARGLHATRVLENKKDFTLESLNDAAYDTYLTWFDKRLAVLFKAWDELPGDDVLKKKTAEQIAVLRGWDQRWSESSIPTSLAVFWGTEVVRKDAANFNVPATAAWDSIDARQRRGLLEALAVASDTLTADFGTWKTPWGEINRFQRLTGDIVQPFSDNAPSIPVGFTSGTWGSLASFGSGPKGGAGGPRTKRWYGTSGNSFVAVVEFGPRIRAKAITAGGESGHPASKHFNDQAEHYAKGRLQEVYFYPAQLKGHTERTYRPGQ